jgi:hypothetical protein
MVCLDLIVYSDSIKSYDDKFIRNNRVHNGSIPYGMKLMTKQGHSARARDQSEEADIYVCLSMNIVVCCIMLIVDCRSNYGCKS